MNDSNHHILPFPFCERTVLSICSNGYETSVEAELAASVIEIFQSACFRPSLKEDQPLVLRFDNPSVQSYCLQNYLTPLELIHVESGTNKVTGITTVQPSLNSGSMIQSFSGLSCAILASPGFASRHHIQMKHSYITLKSLHYAKQA